MMEEVISQVLQQILQKKYHHLLIPAVVFAKVVSVSRSTATYELADLCIFNDDVGSSFKGRTQAYWYQYTLRILDRFGRVDAGYPEIPDIHSKLQLTAGAIVAVGLSNGELSPAIIGEVRL